MSMPRYAIVPLVLIALCLGALAPRAQDDIKKNFEALDEKHDQAGIVALWKENPYATLYVIDSYMEGSMKLMERKGDAAQIKAMQERGLRGARAADEAFGRPIFSDYATSFVGWNDAQRANFRKGQKAHHEASAAMKKKDWAAALKSAEECLVLARPLGDWWGTGMGLTAIGDAQEQAGELEKALEAHSQARLIHHDLGLIGDELQNAVAMARVLAKLGRTPRAERCIEQGLELAALAGDADAKKALEGTREELRAKAGEPGKAPEKKK